MDYGFGELDPFFSGENKELPSNYVDPSLQKDFRGSGSAEVFSLCKLLYSLETGRNLNDPEVAKHSMSKSRPQLSMSHLRGPFGQYNHCSSAYLTNIEEVLLQGWSSKLSLKNLADKISELCVLGSLRDKEALRFWQDNFGKVVSVEWSKFLPILLGSVNKNTLIEHEQIKIKCLEMLFSLNTFHLFSWENF